MLLRDEIVAATQALLDQTGDESKISIREVAARVGCTSPSIYLHFPDKASLMLAVCEHQYAEHEAALSAAVDGIDDPVAALEALASTYVRWSLANPEQFRILFLTDRVRLAGEDVLRQLPGTQGFQLVHETLQRARDAGVIDLDDDADLVPVLLDLWALVQGIATLLVTRGVAEFPDPQAWVRHAVHLVLDGLRPR